MNTEGIKDRGDKKGDERINGMDVSEREGSLIFTDTGSERTRS